LAEHERVSIHASEYKVQKTLQFNVLCPSSFGRTHLNSDSKVRIKTLKLGLHTFTEFQKMFCSIKSLKMPNKYKFSSHYSLVI